MDYSATHRSECKCSICCGKTKKKTKQIYIVKGPKGDRGCRGERGLRGCKGEIGATGATGAKGDSPIDTNGNLTICGNIYTDSLSYSAETVSIDGDPISELKSLSWISTNGSGSLTGFSGSGHDGLYKRIINLENNIYNITYNGGSDEITLYNEGDFVDLLYSDSKSKWVKTNSSDDIRCIKVDTLIDLGGTTGQIFSLNYDELGSTSGLYSSPELIPGKWTNAIAISDNTPGSLVDSIRDIVVDSCGFVYITGIRYGHIYTAKLNNDLTNIEWKVVSTAPNRGNSIDVDCFGNSYQIGSFTGDITFTDDFGTTASLNITPSSSSTIFITKCSSDGELLWVKKIENKSDVDNPVPNDEGHSIKVDKCGNIYVAGFFNGQLYFESAGTLSYMIANSSVPFIAKADSNGNWIWAKSVSVTGGESKSYTYGLNIDECGNVYITGEIGTMSGSFGSISFTITNAPAMFLSKMDKDGNFIWLKIVEKNSSVNENIVGRNLVLDSRGNIYTIGRFEGTVLFDDINLTGLNDNFSDIFIAKCNNNGKWLWAVRAGSNANRDFGYNIQIDRYGYIYCCGSFRGNADFGDFAPVSTTDARDIFITKLNNEGKFLWVKTAGTTSNDNGYSIALDTRQNIYCCGDFNGTSISFDDNILTGDGSIEGFVSKIKNTSDFTPVILVDSGNQNDPVRYFYKRGDKINSFPNSLVKGNKYYLDISTNTLTNKQYSEPFICENIEMGFALDETTFLFDPKNI